MRELEDGIPYWTDRGKVGGMDPLAMLAPIEQLYSRLLTGISLGTVRIRYYAFFAWWMKEYGHGSFSTNRDALNDHVRRGEALVGLISRANEKKGGGLAGEKTFEKYLRDKGPDFDLRSLRSQYLDVPAFFAVYGSQMSEMGILQRNKHGILAPTKNLGLPLAEAFEEAIGNEAAQLFREICQHPTVQLKTLKKMKPMSINFSYPLEETRELELLRLAFTGKCGTGERRNTILEILNFAQIKGDLPSELLVRFEWLEHLPEAGALRFEERLKWAHFQVADSLRVSMESILRHCVQSLSDHGPMDSHELASEVCSVIPANFNLRNYFVHLVESADALPTREFQEVAKKDGTSFVQKVNLVAKLWFDWSSKVQEMDKIFPPKDHFRTSATEMRCIISLEDRDAQSAMAEFVRHRILSRHLLVASRKLRFQGNNTFQFEYEEGKFVARRTGNVDAARPRLGTAISFLKQLGFLGETGLTDLGRLELIIQ